MVQETQIYKIMIAGDGGVGKTSIIERFLGRPFRANALLGTIGVQMWQQEIEVKESTCRLLLLETMISPRFRYMLPTFVKGASGALLVFDITRATTTETLRDWVEEVLRFQDENLPILLCGNKNDLQNEREVSGNQAKEFLDPLNLFNYVETSAKTDIGILDAFQLLTKELQIAQGLG